MVKRKLSELVEEMALPIVSEAGMELVDVEFVKEGGRRYLRIFIDKPGGICHEDCKYVSQEMDKLLDDKELIPYSYFLEVSSPGITRQLKKPADFIRFAGKLVNITTFAPFNGRKKFTGRIIAIRGNELAVEIDGSELLIPFKQIASAKPKMEF